MVRRAGLGKGLNALIPTEENPRAVTGSGYEELPIAKIRPNPYQPRDYFDEEALTVLTDSIREVGVLQPVLVRPIGEEYELIAGERRLRASKRVGLKTIPAVVRDTDDTTALEHALIENLHRSDLNPLEEAAAYQQLIEDFKLTHDQVATRVGRSRAAVTNTLRLMQLPASIQKLVRENKLSMGHARALLGTPDRAFQEQLAKRIVKDGLSVRSVEDAVKGRDEVEPESVAERVERARPSTQLRPPGLLELEELLGDLLETRVNISMNAKVGKVTIDFSSLDDLERIYRIMSGGARG
ncbi:MAG: ParB/RepB/Spo0J family partition protein [Acidimicrobiia bacterium]